MSINGLKTQLIILAVAIPIGILWGILAILESSPNPSSWLGKASPIIGGLSGVLFVTVFIIIRRRHLFPKNNPKDDEESEK